MASADDSSFRTLTDGGNSSTAGARHDISRSDSMIELTADAGNTPMPTTPVSVIHDYRGSYYDRTPDEPSLWKLAKEHSVPKLDQAAMLAKSFGDAKKGTEQQQQHQLPPKKHKLRHLPRIEINWCCSLPFNVIFISLLVLVVLVSSVPMWTGSQVLLYDSQSKAMDDITLLGVDMAIAKVTDLFQQLEWKVREQCRYAVATDMDLDDAAEFAALLPKFVTSLRGTPPTGIRLQYATQNHVGVVQSFLDPGVTNDDATMIASWSYNGSTAIMVGPIDPTYGTLQAQINLGMTLDSLEPGTSFYEPDELMHIFDLGLPMWNRLSYIPVTLSVALQYNYPCAIENRSKIFASGLFGPMTLRYYLSKLVGNVTLVYLMNVEGYLISASVPWDYFEPWLNSYPFNSQATLIPARNFTNESRITDTWETVLTRIRDHEGDDFAYDDRVETSGYYADRVASEGVLKNCGIDGKNYHIRYKHIVNDQTRLDYVMVAVTSTAARDAVMRQSTIYHVSIFLGCLAAALIVVAVIVKVFRPIGQLTELLYDTCALFFGRKLDSYGSVDDGLVSELSSIRDGSSASNTRPNIGNFGLKGGTPESGLNTPSATSAVTPSSSSSSGIVDLVQKRGGKSKPWIRLRFGGTQVRDSSTSSSLAAMLGGDEDGAETRELGVFNSSFVREVRLLARAAHINRTISVITVKNTSQQYLRYVLADPLRQDLYVESLRCTTVMMVDVHDFTKITERTLEKEKLIVLLAAFFTHVETTAQKWGMPYLVKRIGDAVLLLFNSNLNPEDPEHAKNAIRAAISIHYEAMPKINDEVKTGWPTCPAKKPITVSVGMATGSVLAGNIGRRCDDGCSVDGSWNYDIIGSTVNKAARVSSAKLRSGTRRRTLSVADVHSYADYICPIDAPGITITRENMICVIPGCTFAAAFRSGRSGSPFGAGVGNDGASSDLYLTEDIRDSGGQNHRPTVFSSQVADIDASWLPPNVACVECIPLVMRNISAPERIHVLIDVTAP